MHPSAPPGVRRHDAGAGHYNGANRDIALTGYRPKKIYPAIMERIFNGRSSGKIPLWEY